MSDIDIHERNGLGLVTLDRPATLHALTQEMIQAFHARLRAWAVDPAIRAVVVQGSGARAFCAGGDIVSVWRAGMERRDGRGDGALTRTYFRSEYPLDRATRMLPKPYVALLDGVTMGGGVGISAYGSHAVATERTLWAMPETVIGFFPDVGTTWLLPRLPGRTGYWLGLTGARLRAADLLALGLVRAHVPSARLPDLLDALAALAWDSAPAQTLIDETLRSFSCAPDGPAEVETQRAAIDRCFGRDSVEAIRATLVQEDTEWADRQVTALDRASPTALKVTLEALRRGAEQDFETCLRMEFGLSQAVCARPDFYEGVRAALVDKDRSPRWQPDTLAAVSAEAVAAHFVPPEGPQLDFAEGV